MMPVCKDFPSVFSESFLIGLPPKSGDWLGLRRPREGDGEGGVAEYGPHAN